jgi:hypothetical protein
MEIFRNLHKTIRKRSEWHRNRVELRADIGRIGRTELLCDVAIEVVQHEADIAVGVPVQRRGVDRLSSAGDAVCAGKLIVQIDGREADGDLPSAPAAARELLLEGQYSEARLDKVSNAIQEALVGYRHGGCDLHEPAVGRRPQHPLRDVRRLSGLPHKKPQSR